MTYDRESNKLSVESFRHHQTTMGNPHIKQYRNRLGATQWMPSTKLVERLIAKNEGFCLACTHEQPNVEPDAVRVKCESCGKHKVYGAERLVLMNLTFEAILH